jgi:C4-dicarboxylate-specific signal transduction histidine kinase
MLFQRSYRSRSEIRPRERDGLFRRSGAFRRQDLRQDHLVDVARFATLGEMTASIAHEINQPLVAITANAEACLNWLAKEDPNLDEARLAAEDILRSGRRAGDLVRSTLALVRKSSSHMEPLDINETIDELLDIMRADLRQHDVSLTTEFAADLRAVTGDRVQLQQVIANLVMNGIEAMSLVTDRSRELRVSTQLDGSRNVLIAVVDSGTGLDPTVADRIFAPLFTTKRNGLGIGLSICRLIVETHGGRLWAGPHWPYGTAFRFTLPHRTDYRDTRQQIARAACCCPGGRNT